MKLISKMLLAVLMAAGLALAFVPRAALAADDQATLKQEADNTLSMFKQKDTDLNKALKQAAAYVVFPNITKGALVVGGAGGDGILYEQGKATGTVKVSQASIGLQAGGGTYSELLFLQTPAAVASLKAGDLKLTSSVNGITATAGARAEYKDGLAVMTLSKGGAMVDLSVGGQSFKYQALTPSSKPGS